VGIFVSPWIKYKNSRYIMIISTTNIHLTKIFLLKILTRKYLSTLTDAPLLLNILLYDPHKVFFYGLVGGLGDAAGLFACAVYEDDGGEQGDAGIFYLVHV